MTDAPRALHFSCVLTNQAVATTNLGHVQVLNVLEKDTSGEAIDLSLAYSLRSLSWSNFYFSTFAALVFSFRM